MDKAARISKAREIFNLPSPVAQKILTSEFSPLVTVTKSVAPDYQVFGWASVAFTNDGQVEDQEGHLIDIVDLEKAAYSFVATSDIPANDMHTSAPFGRLVESMIFTPEKIDLLKLPSDFQQGWWVGMELPPEHYEAVVSGKRPMLSIEGFAKTEPFAT